MAKLIWQVLLVGPMLAGCANILGMELSQKPVAASGGTSGNADAGASGGTSDGGESATGGAAAGGASATGGASAGGVSATGGSKSTGTSTVPTDVNLVWMSNGTASSFFDTSRNGASKAAYDLTQAGQAIRYTNMDPSSNQATAQVARIQDAVAAGANALGIDVIDPTVVGPVIDDVVTKGVTVVTFDSDAPGSKRISYYGIDNRKGGVVAAKILMALMGSSGGNIAIMHKESPPTAANFVARRDGFMSEIGNNKAFKVAVELPCTDGATGESTLMHGCADELETTIDQHPEVTGWFLSRGRVLRESTLATLAPRWTSKIKAGTFFAVSFDAIPESMANIQAGYVNAVINQKYYGWGYDVVKLLFDIVHNKSSVTPFTDSGFDVVCANNVSEVAAAWLTPANFSTISKCSLAGQQWP